MIEVGSRIGRVVVVKDLGRSGGHRSWLCECECGCKQSFRQSYIVQRGNTLCCVGCYTRGRRGGQKHRARLMGMRSEAEATKRHDAVMAALNAAVRA